jgi:hypothetical protein
MSFAWLGLGWDWGNEYKSILTKLKALNKGRSGDARVVLRRLQVGGQDPWHSTNGATAPGLWFLEKLVGRHS